MKPCAELEIAQARAKMNRFGRERRPFIFLIDFDMSNSVVLPAEEAASQGIWFSFNGISNQTATHNPTFSTLTWKKQPISFETYIKAFNEVQRELRHGNSYLLNLTFSTTLETNLSLTDMFLQSSAPYRILFKQKFIVFSPEIFVKIQNNRISSYPMKGTIDATIPNAATTILNDPKELSEHITIVDLIRNDLSMIAKNVRVDKFRYLDCIQTNERELFQVSSCITGSLPPSFEDEIGTLLFKLLPAGSVTGAPKKKCVELIKNIETYSRGFYTGVAGHFDGQNLDSCVMIRFIEKTSEGYIYKSGGGITLQSTVEKEYQELVDKVYLPIINPKQHSKCKSNEK